MVDQRTFLYLCREDVDRCMPTVERQLELADVAMESLATGNAIMPPKPVLPTRDDPLRGEFHALPAYFRKEDIAGCKWSCTFAGNAARGIPSVSATIILSDPDTGVPIAVLDGTVVTGHRTAAVSGAAIKRFAPASVKKVAIWGTGFQARTHVPVLASLVPGCAVWAYDSDESRLDSFASWAQKQQGIESVVKAKSAKAALEGADLIITATTTHTAQNPFVTPDLPAEDCLLVPLEWELQVPASTVRQAARFIVDDRGEFFLYREMDTVDFAGYPDPDETLGEAILRGAKRADRPSGLIVSSALGTGAADVIAATEVLRNAVQAGVGVQLPL